MNLHEDLKRFKHILSMKAIYYKNLDRCFKNILESGWDKTKEGKEAHKKWKNIGYEIKSPCNEDELIRDLLQSCCSTVDSTIVSCEPTEITLDDLEKNETKSP